MGKEVHSWVPSCLWPSPPSPMGTWSPLIFFIYCKNHYNDRLLSFHTFLNCRADNSFNSVDCFTFAGTMASISPMISKLPVDGMGMTPFSAQNFMPKITSKSSIRTLALPLGILANANSEYIIYIFILYKKF